MTGSGTVVSGVVPGIGIVQMLGVHLLDDVEVLAGADGDVGVDVEVADAGRQIDAEARVLAPLDQRVEAELRAEHDDLGAARRRRPW